jgi:hypothetical protein
MKKFLPYILILIALFGLFSVAGKVSAVTTTEPPTGEPVGHCTVLDPSKHGTPGYIVFDAPSTSPQCT